MEAWIAVQIDGARGPLYRSGDLDADHHLDPGAHKLGGLLLGGDGHPLLHHDILQARSVGELRLLLPGQPFVERFSMDGVAVEAADHPITVRSRLLYRRANQGFVDYVFGAGVRTMPVQVLIERSCEVAGPGAPCEVVSGPAPPPEPQEY